MMKRFLNTRNSLFVLGKFLAFNNVSTEAILNSIEGLKGQKPIDLKTIKAAWNDARMPREGVITPLAIL